MVGGNLAVLEDHFITCSGRKVDLKIYAADKVIDQCQYAMQALKKSMAWDEEHYGREYDLDIFMIVAVNDFNFGAMENKGLNIFNDKYILVDSQTATDTDYGLIDAVVGHEYFHNWSGNRVTVRDWFQLSLKEGLTVFRDHSFSETIGSAAIERINQVKKLRAAQFPEDAGPLAHPIRPDSYIEMSNFYTATVYEKGSEVIRMMKTILGPENYRKGTDLYFDRNDGKAVTCDDFVQAMQDASGIDLTLFKRWYCQSGTPVVKAETTYDEEEQTLTIVLEQTCPPTPGQESKEPFHIPVEIGLLDSNGKDMTFSLAGDLQGTTCVLNLITAEQPFVLTGVTEKPTVSFLRGFSAPVKLDFNYTDEELAFLMAHDSDAVARWEAGQTLMVNSLFALMEQHQQGESLTMPTLLLNSMQALLAQAEEDDKALIAEMLLLPSEFYLIELMETVDVDALVTARRFLKHAIAENLRDSLLAVYKANPVDEQFEYEVAAVARRSLRNACLNYLMQLEEEGMQKLGFDQFESANNMTDEIAAINLLASSTTNYRSQAMNAFYDKWLDNNLVMDKWFIAQALSKQANTVEHIRELMEDKAFNIKNPNKVRSLLGAFTRNFSEFHSANGEGYKLIAEQTIVIDKLNPMVAARLVTGMAQWKRFNGERAQLMKQQLERILATEGLSKDTYEIVSKSLTA
jgi:aminopeptidase N